MMSRLLRLVMACGVSVWALSITSLGQSGEVDLIDHPAIQYRTKPTRDPITALQQRIDSAAIALSSDGPSGVLRSLLRELDVPLSSQIMVFSKGSVQSARIEANNPRALYFNDSIVVGWVRGGFIEIAAQDPEQGTVFYTLRSSWVGRPTIARSDDCLSCHNTNRTRDVAGLIEPMGHARPLENRWGGWYVTGSLGSIRHLGNMDMATVLKNPAAVNSAQLSSLERQFDVSGYLTPYSDIGALMVFEHQMQMMNRLTRLGWETRVAMHDGRLDAQRTQVRDRVSDVVDYLLFVDEAPIASPIKGTSGFAEAFSNNGPRDSKGRSLKQLDLTTRLLRYPCSYMIYSTQFDRLPPPAKTAVYERMWAILSGAEQDPKYRRLSADARRAIVDILRETKSDLPAVFKGAVK
jgi:hypothetical protein